MPDGRSGPDVLLVHGWGGSFESTWQRPGIDRLIEDAGRRVIGVDLLGHGQAPKPHDAEAYRDLTSRLRDAIDQSPVDAIGFSLGALTLLQLALDTPGYFRRLVLAGIGSNVLAPTAISDLDDDLRRETIERQFERYSSMPDNDPIALAAVLQRPMGAPISPDDLARLELPILVVIGDEDFLGPADEFVACLPNGDLTVLARTDHFATVERFDFIDRALQFLEIEP